MSWARSATRRIVRAMVSATRVNFGGQDTARRVVLLQDGKPLQFASASAKVRTAGFPEAMAFTSANESSWPPMSSALLTADSPVITCDDEPSLRLQGLPHVGIKRPFGHVPIDSYFVVVVPLAKDAALPLLDLGRFPGGIKVMKGDKPTLHVHAGAHLLRGAHEHADRAIADPLKEGLFLGITIGVPDSGNLRSGNAPVREELPSIPRRPRSPKASGERPSHRR